MNIIGLDIGTKRIGVAKSNVSTRIAVPDGTITVNGNEFVELIRLSRLYNVDTFVLGMPRNNSGEETQQSQYVRGFADKLTKTIPGVKIYFQDESLTSVEAEERLKARKKNYGKGEIDAEAAAIILQDFLESHAQPGSFEPQLGAPSVQPMVSAQATMPAQSIQNVAQQPVAVQNSSAPVQQGLNAENYENPIQSSVTTGETEKEKKSPVKKIAIILAVLILTFGIAGISAYSWYDTSLHAVAQGVDCSNSEDEECKDIDFVIVDGDNVQIIGDGLEEKGLIKSSFVFQIYAKMHDKANNIKAGKYKLKKTMDVKEILDLFNKGSNDEPVFSFTVLPGEKISEVKKKLLDIGYKETEVEQAFAKKYDHPVFSTQVSTKQYGAEPLEGYLFGDTYEFYEGEKVETIITTMLDALYKAIQDNNLIERFSKQGLTLYQGITLASIVQREANPTDMPGVAQVFLTRKRTNMMLGSDVTVQYALDLVDPNREKYTDNVSALTIDSPYNTRMNPGLTPGPICNPGIDALNAVAEPANTTYLYFLTGDDGRMYYGSTEAEHQDNIQKYCQNLCKVSL